MTIKQRGVQSAWNIPERLERNLGHLLGVPRVPPAENRRGNNNTAAITSIRAPPISPI